MSKSISYALVALVLLLSLSATCLGSAAPSSFVASELAGRAIRDGKPLEVAVVMADLYSEFCVSLSEYAKWMLEQAGAKVTVLNSNFDANAQMSQLTDLVQRGVDAIIIQPVDCEALAPAALKVNAAGVPLVVVNRPVIGKNVRMDLGVFVDDVALGRKAAEHVVSKAAGTSGKVLTVQGALATANARDRAAGFAAVDNSSNVIRVISDRPCEWLSESAMTAVVDVLATHPDLCAVFSHSDCMLPGVISGLKQAGKCYEVGDKRHVIVVSVDGAPYALDQIRKNYVDATVENSPLMLATIAVKGVLTRVAKGLPLGEKTVMIEPIVVTKANVDDPSLWGNFDVSKHQLWPMTEAIWNQYLKY